MNKLQMLWAAGLAGSWLLTGCAGDAQKPRARNVPSAVVTTSPCDGSDDQVTLNQIAVPASAASASVRVNPGKAWVDKAKGGVRWKIAGNKYLFTDDGITFKSYPPNPAGPASSGVSSDRSEYWWCFDASPPGATWSYTIKFYDKDLPLRVFSCDPVIVNFDSFMATVRKPEDIDCN